MGRGRVERERWALILAGGEGKRLEGVTRQIAGAPVPKQYCRLLGSRSLLEMTVERVRAFVPAERTMVIVTDSHRSLAEEQLAAHPGIRVLSQPENRDTGPGIVSPLLWLERAVGDATVTVFPSDHYVADEPRFLEQVRLAAEFVERYRHRIALLGIVPDREDPELGYVLPGRAFSLRGAMGQAFRVQRFIEKPPPAESARLVARGALWNSFVLVFRLATLVRLVERLLPEHMQALRDTTRAADPCSAFRSLAPWNFSRDFLAGATAALAVWRTPEVGWSDCGTLESLLRTVPRLPSLPPWLSPVPTSAATSNPLEHPAMMGNR